MSMLYQHGMVKCGGFQFQQSFINLLKLITNYNSTYSVHASHKNTVIGEKQQQKPKQIKSKNADRKPKVFI